MVGYRLLVFSTNSWALIRSIVTDSRDTSHAISPSCVAIFRAVTSESPISELTCLEVFIVEIEANVSVLPRIKAPSHIY